MQWKAPLRVPIQFLKSSGYQLRMKLGNQKIVYLRNVW